MQPFWVDPFITEIIFLLEPPELTLASDMSVLFNHHCHVLVVREEHRSEVLSECVLLDMRQPCQGSRPQTHGKLEKSFPEVSLGPSMSVCRCAKIATAGPSSQVCCK